MGLTRKTRVENEKYTRAYGQIRRGRGHIGCSGHREVVLKLILEERIDTLWTKLDLDLVQWR